jgi:peptidyl-dipeptidase Dcp
VRAGAKLSAADKDQAEGLQRRDRRPADPVRQNVLKEANASALVVDSRAELAGMSDKADRRRRRGSEEARPGRQVRDPGREHHPAGAAVVLTNRATRESACWRPRWRAAAAAANSTTASGAEAGQGCAPNAPRCWATRTTPPTSLEDQTAKTTGAVNKLLAEFAKPAVNNAKKEAAEIQKVIDAEKGGFQAAAHDWAFYSDKVRARQRYAFDENQLRPTSN